MSDLINRADAIEAIQNAYCKPCKERGDDYNEVRCRACEYDNAIIQIDALPSAEAIQGEWIEVEVFPEVYDIEGVKTWGSEMQCDQCGFRHTAIEGHMAQYNFCPNCGAKMKGGEDDDQTKADTKLSVNV